MYQNNSNERKIATFKKLSRKPYALFSCLNREVRIGVLGVSTLTFASLGTATAQTTTHHTTSPTETTPEYKLDEVAVTGSLAPLTATQSARIVTVITRKEIERSAAQSVNDLLKLAVGVDVRQRGGFGVQTDISLDGGTFDQVTLLLNGVNINSPQTGHLTADFPVSVDDIERIEVLEGAASRVYGSSAFSGAINIVTRQGKASRGEVGLQGGSYGTVGTHAAIGLSQGAFDSRLSGNLLRSDRGTTNSSFRNANVFYIGSYNASKASPNPTDNLKLSWQAGYSGKGYGANTFYSGAFPNQYEADNRIFAAVKAETGRTVHFAPTVYWNRTYDHFQLVHNTSYGENYHRTDVFGTNLNAYFNWWGGRTSFGAEMRNEGILSTNLGRPLAAGQQPHIAGTDTLRYTHRDNRTNISYYAEHNILWHRFTLSLGIMANQNSALDSKFRFYPGVDLSYRPTEAWKFFASWDKALRMPSFTDLYYKSPTQQGNVGLKPEETQSFLAGAKYGLPWLQFTANAFYHRGRHMIDWVMYSATDVYHSANFRLDNMGYTLQATLLPRQLTNENCFVEQVYVGYTYIHQKRHDNVEIYKSNYALEYLRHKFVARLDHRIAGPLSASWDFRWQDRMGSYLVYQAGKSTGTKTDYKPYGLLNLKLQWKGRNYLLYAEADNLTSHRYYDLGNVRQPGIWFMFGARYSFSL